jgi:predicted TIM-barrel fold metal-dependent hydrolase
VKLVVDHLGRPDPKLGIQCKGFQMMLRLIENGRTWVKASGIYRLGRAECAAYGREILRLHGPDRLLWASDCPFVGNEKAAKYQETIDAVLEWVPAAARDKVFSGNALALYF